MHRPLILKIATPSIGQATTAVPSCWTKSAASAPSPHPRLHRGLPALACGARHEGPALEPPPSLAARAARRAEHVARAPAGPALPRLLRARGTWVWPDVGERQRVCMRVALHRQSAIWPAGSCRACITRHSARRYRGYKPLQVVTSRGSGQVLGAACNSSLESRPRPLPSAALPPRGPAAPAPGPTPRDGRRCWVAPGPLLLLLLPPPQLPLPPRPAWRRPPPRNLRQLGSSAGVALTMVPMQSMLCRSGHLETRMTVAAAQVFPKQDKSTCPARRRTCSASGAAGALRRCDAAGASPPGSSTTEVWRAQCSSLLFWSRQQSLHSAAMIWCSTISSQ